MVFLLEIPACVTISNTKMNFHIGIYFQEGVSQLEKYGSYRNWTIDNYGHFLFKNALHSYEILIL